MQLCRIWCCCKLVLSVQVYSISPRFVPRVMRRIVEAVVDELARLIQCVTGFNRNGALQVRGVHCGWGWSGLEALSVLLALLKGIRQSLVDSPHKEPVVWSFDVFSVFSLKLLNKQSSCQWLGMPWGVCDINIMGTGYKCCEKAWG